MQLQSSSSTTTTTTTPTKSLGTRRRDFRKFRKSSSSTISSSSLSTSLSSPSSSPSSSSCLLPPSKSTINNYTNNVNTTHSTLNTTLSSLPSPSPSLSSPSMSMSIPQSPKPSPSLSITSSSSSSILTNAPRKMKSTSTNIRGGNSSSSSVTASGGTASSRPRYYHHRRNLSFTSQQSSSSIISALSTNSNNSSLPSLSSSPLPKSTKLNESVSSINDDGKKKKKITTSSSSSSSRITRSRSSSVGRFSKSLLRKRFENGSGSNTNTNTTTSTSTTSSNRRSNFAMKNNDDDTTSKQKEEEEEATTSSTNACSKSSSKTNTTTTTIPTSSYHNFKLLKKNTLQQQQQRRDLSSSIEMKHQGNDKSDTNAAAAVASTTNNNISSSSDVKIHIHCPHDEEEIHDTEDHGGISRGSNNSGKDQDPFTKTTTTSTINNSNPVSTNNDNGVSRTKKDDDNDISTTNPVPAPIPKPQSTITNTIKNITKKKNNHHHHHVKEDDEKEEFTYSNLHTMWLQRDQVQKQKNINIKVRPPTATTPIQLKISKSPIRQRIGVVTSVPATTTTTTGNKSNCVSSSSGGGGNKDTDDHAGDTCDTGSDVKAAGSSKISSDNTIADIKTRRNDSDFMMNGIKVASDNKSTTKNNSIGTGTGTGNNTASSDSSRSSSVHKTGSNDKTTFINEGCNDNNDDKESSVVSVKSAIQSLQNAFLTSSTTMTATTARTTTKSSAGSFSTFNVPSKSSSLLMESRTKKIDKKKSIQPQDVQSKSTTEHHDGDTNDNDDDLHHHHDRNHIEESNDCSYNEEITTLLFKTNSNNLPFDDEIDDAMNIDKKKKGQEETSNYYSCNVGNIGPGQDDNNGDEDNNHHEQSFISMTSELVPRRLMDSSMSQSDREEENMSRQEELKHSPSPPMNKDGMEFEFPVDKEPETPSLPLQNDLDSSINADDPKWHSQDKGLTAFMNFEGGTQNTMFDPFNDIASNEVKHQWEDLSFESLPSMESKDVNKYDDMILSGKTTDGSPSSLVETTASSTKWSSSLVEESNISSSFSNQNDTIIDTTSNVFEPFNALDTMISRKKEDTNDVDGSILSWQEQSFESMGNNQYVEVPESKNQHEHEEPNALHSSNLNLAGYSSNQLIGLAATRTSDNSFGYTGDFNGSIPTKPSDPYDFYDSMSTANSELTVKIENKVECLSEEIETNAVQNQISSCKLETQKGIGFHDIQTFSFDCNDDDKESTIPDSAFGIAQSEAKLETLSSSSINLRTLAIQQNDIFNKTGAVGTENYCSGQYDDNDENDHDSDTCNESSIFSFPSHIGCMYNGQKALSDSGTDVFDGLSSVAGPSAANSSVLAMDLFAKSLGTAKIQGIKYSIAEEGSEKIHKFNDGAKIDINVNSSERDDLAINNGVDNLNAENVQAEMTSMLLRKDLKDDNVENNGEGVTKINDDTDKIQSDSKNTTKSQKKRFGKYLANLAAKAKASNITRAWRGGKSATKNEDLRNDVEMDHDSHIGISRPPLTNPVAKREEENIREIDEVKQPNEIHQHSTPKKFPEITPILDEKAPIYEYECPPIEDIKAKIGWIPSMIRLYEKKLPNQKQTNPAIQSSELVNPTIEECKLAGTQFLQLNSNRSIGRLIVEPSPLIQSSCSHDYYKPLRKKLRQFLASKNIWHDRQIVRKGRSKIFEKAIETHERVLALLVNDHYDNALELYEKFFESYTHRDFAIDDKKLEKRIIAIILFNMAILYVCEQDFKLGAEFFMEAIESLEKSDSSEQEICSYYIELGITYYSLGEFEDALKIFEENLSKMKICNNHHFIVKLLNNVGSTQFAQQNISASLHAFFEVLETQRTYFIKRFGTRLQIEENEVGDFKAGLQSMSFTLQNLSYVHAFIDDQSTSSFFSEIAASINDSLITRDKKLENDLPLSQSETIEL